MIRSMTGFGRAVFEAAGASFAVELRSVNQRNLDLSVRLPRSFAGLEPELRKSLAQRFSRGKVELGVALAAGSGPRAELEVDRSLVQRYLELSRELARESGVVDRMGVAELLAMPGVIRTVEASAGEGDAGAALLEAAGRAASAGLAMREAEGAALERELRARLANVSAIVAEIGGRAGEVQRAVRERMRARAEQLRAETGLLDEARLYHEVALAAERLDVTEELARLASHVEQFLTALASDEPVGRRLDFLTQELAREANTLGAKAGDAPLAHRVVDLKTEIDRIREQAQNIE
ncbi:MAG: YicC/YloC family endoribonuclease [Myxococcota bacterium]